MAEEKIYELLTRGVDTIYPSKQDLEKVLKSGKKLRIYQGFDPTSPQLHIGHLMGLRKLSQWQKLGHEVIFLIGDFTGMIGDPTGKDTTRIVLTRAQVLENAKTYKQQASKVLDFEGKNPVKIKYNSEWLAKISTSELLSLSHYLSVNQLIKRDFFKKRFENDKDVALNEFMYPLLQAYDSVAMDVDVEVGGTDQMFNMMVGRDLMHKMKQKNKFVMTTPILADANGIKIGKSEGNAIALTDKPSELFGKIMGLSDEVILKALEYLTDISMDEIGKIKQKIDSGENPIVFKKKLAFEIVKQLNDTPSAQEAEENFGKTVQNKQTPDGILEIKVKKGSILNSDLLVKLGLAVSKSAAKRLFEQGGVEADGGRITLKDAVEAAENMIIKVGPRKFAKIKIK